MVEVAEVENLDFKWGKKRGIGGKKKDVQFYESFTYDGVEYTLYDCVYLYKEGDAEPHVGKLIKIWENADKAKKVKLLWFFRPSDISNFLGNVQTLENELILACGEGVGLTNINPLEAIAGKCNVVCTSKDARNPQPSDEELQISDFIFSRTFDVELRKVLDKIDEKIAGIEVKFIFNREGYQNSSVALKLDSNKKEVSKNATISDETVISAQQNIPESVSTKQEGGFIDTSVKQGVEASLIRQNSSLLDNVDLESGGKAKSGEGLEDISINSSNLRSKVKENEHTKVLTTKQKSSFAERPVSSVDSKAWLVGMKSSLGEKVSSIGGAQQGEIVRTIKPGITFGDKIASSSKVGFEKSKAKSSKALETKEEVKSFKDPNELYNGPSNKAKFDSSRKVFDDKIKNRVQKLGLDSNVHGPKPTLATIADEDKSKTKRAVAKDPHGIDKGPCKKPKLDEELLKPTSGKLVEASSLQPSIVENKSNKQIVEVTRRPSLDRSKWFKELPWEERIRVAHEHGTLVVLENLDPSYTSTVVEDLVWHAFKENCSAKMIPRVAFASPYSGQSFVIFKTREVAELVVTKLEEGCLLLSNGRPLLGSIGTPCFTGKQSKFVGHLALDKLKFQMQREMREAVSTSHCSQPNSLEYDMAIEWSLLQERLDCAWKKLYEQQELELKKLKVKLKSK